MYLASIQFYDIQHRIQPTIIKVQRFLKIISTSTTAIEIHDIHVVRQPTHSKTYDNPCADAHRQQKPVKIHHNIAAKIPCLILLVLFVTFVLAVRFLMLR